jgi:hypothetical protein
MHIFHLIRVIMLVHTHSCTTSLIYKGRKVYVCLRKVYCMNLYIFMCVLSLQCTTEHLKANTVSEYTLSIPNTSIELCSQNSLSYSGHVASFLTVTQFYTKYLHALYLKRLCTKCKDKMNRFFALLTNRQ